MSGTGNNTRDSEVYIFLLQHFADAVNAGRADPLMAPVQDILDRREVRLEQAEGEHNSCFVLRTKEGASLSEMSASAIVAEIRTADNAGRIYAGAVTGPRPGR